MNVLVDSNILLRTVEPSHTMHAEATASVAALLAGQQRPCLVSQVLYEFWVVGRRPIAQNGLGMSVARGDLQLSRFKSQFPVHDDVPAIRPIWEQLILKYQVMGKTAHDTRLVAAMIVHAIARILTFNTPDFQRYTEIQAIAPADVIAAHAKGGTP